MLFKIHSKCCLVKQNIRCMHFKIDNFKIGTTFSTYGLQSHLIILTNIFSKKNIETPLYVGWFYLLFECGINYFITLNNYYFIHSIFYLFYGGHTKLIAGKFEKSNIRDTNLYTKLCTKTITLNNCYFIHLFF